MGTRMAAGVLVCPFEIVPEPRLLIPFEGDYLGPFQAEGRYQAGKYRFILQQHHAIAAIAIAAAGLHVGCLKLIHQNQVERFVGIDRQQYMLVVYGAFDLHSSLRI